MNIVIAREDLSEHPRVDFRILAAQQELSNNLARISALDPIKPEKELIYWLVSVIGIHLHLFTSLFIN
jgi:hypothetical protein